MNIHNGFSAVLVVALSLFYLFDGVLSHDRLIKPNAEQMEKDVLNMKIWKEFQEVVIEEDQQQQQYRRMQDPTTIPVYFHVIQQSDTLGNSNDTRIEEYMTYLNAAFANTSVPFIFALQNITRTTNENWALDCFNEEFEIEYKKKLKANLGADVLNIYSCYRAPDRTIGQTIMPYEGIENDVLDGVILLYDLGLNDERNNELVHQVGHWLGLYHTYEGDSCKFWNKNDQVDDTPQHNLPRSGRNCCNINPNCQPDYTLWNTCPNRPGEDPFNNYMTSTNVEGQGTENHRCRKQFTSGQVNRMVAQFDLYRRGKKPDPNYECKRGLRKCTTNGNCCSETCGIIGNREKRCKIFPRTPKFF